MSTEKFPLIKKYNLTIYYLGTGPYIHANEVEMILEHLEIELKQFDSAEESEELH